MTKRELVMLIAERFGYTQHEVGGIVQATLDTITEALTEGHRLEIRNFGVFEVKTRDPRVGRNPRTGEEVPISEKRVATFKPGKAIKELVEGTVPVGPTVVAGGGAPDSSGATPDPSGATQDSSGVSYAPPTQTASDSAPTDGPEAPDQSRF